MRALSLLVALTPFLSLVDAVDAAPARGVVAGIARDAGAHRRALVDIPDSPWHRRSKRQLDNLPVGNDGGNDGGTGGETGGGSEEESPVPTPPASAESSEGSTDESPAPSPGPTDQTPTEGGNGDVEGPPSVITVSVPTSTSTTSTSTSTSTSTESTSTSTDTSTSSEVQTTSSTPPPLPPVDPTSTSTPTTSSTEETPIISLPTISLPTISIPTIDLPSIPLPTISIPDVTPDPTVSDPSTSTSAPINTDPPPTSDPVTDPPPSTSTPIISNPPTSTSTSSPVLNVTDIFPTITNTDVDTPTITVTETSTTSRVPITIDSQYQFLTASLFIIAPPLSTTSAPLTLTDPDAPLTSVSLITGGSATTLVLPPVPSTVPLFITPPVSADPVPAGTDIPGFTEINILFQPTARWTFVLQSSDTAAQILAYVPEIIKAALEITNPDDVRTVGLKAFQPATYTNPDDLLTIWDGYIPTDQVATLAAMIRAANSAFYNLDDSVARSVAKNIDGSYDIATLNGVSNVNGGSNTVNTAATTRVDNSRRNAIIGVSVAFGLIALSVLVWWIMKTYKARQEGMHKRLSYEGNHNYGAAGAGVAVGYDRSYGFGANAEPARADSPPNLHNPFMTEREREEEARGIRRNSFYAIGPDDASIEEETFDYMSQRSSNGGLNRAGSGGHGGGGGGWLTVNGANNGGAGRRPVVGQPISQPILRESSMGNW